MNAPVNIDHEALARSLPARQAGCERPRALPGRRLDALLPPAAAGGPGPLDRREHVRPALVHHQVQRHHEGRARAQDAVLGLRPTAASPSATGRRICACRCSSPWTRRSTTSSARRCSPSSRRPTWRSWKASSASACCRILDGLAARRDLQLGGPRLHRADGADAGDPLRLPLRGPPQALLLVRLRDGAAGCRAA